MPISSPALPGVKARTAFHEPLSDGHLFNLGQRDPPVAV